MTPCRSPATLRAPTHASAFHMRSEDTLNRLVLQLTQNCGDWLAAARTTGVSLQFVRQWMKDDPHTADTLNEAAQVGTQGLVSAAIQRAVHGVEEGVYYKGARVATERKYSDTLLTTLLKAKVDEFRQESAQPTVQVNIANLMPRAASYEEWLAMKDNTMRALPTPAAEDVIEGEFVPTEVAKAAEYIMRNPADDPPDPFKGVEL